MLASFVEGIQDCNIVDATQEVEACEGAIMKKVYLHN